MYSESCDLKYSKQCKVNKVCINRELCRVCVEMPLRSWCENVYSPRERARGAPQSTIFLLSLVSGYCSFQNQAHVNGCLETLLPHVRKILGATNISVHFSRDGVVLFNADIGVSVDDERFIRTQLRLDGTLEIVEVSGVNNDECEASYDTLEFHINKFYKETGIQSTDDNVFTVERNSNGVYAQI